MWLQIPEHHNAVTLDQFIVMPNHIHRIIELKGDRVSDVACNVATKDNSKTMSDISPKKGSLGTIVRSYKSAVTNWCHTNVYPDFVWQSKFHDHIIRNQKDLDRIRNYIRDNPANWEGDRRSPSALEDWMD